MRLCITIAVQMQVVIVGWQIYEQTKDPLSLGLVGLAEVIPYLLIALFAGHVADIFNRKKIIVASVFIFLLSALLLLYFTLDFSTILSIYGVFPIYLVIFITGFARGFMWPAAFALMSQLVPKELYPNSSTWNSTIWQTGAVSGSALGGLIYGFYGITAAYAFCACFIFLGIALLGFIPGKPIIGLNKKEPLMDSLKTGVKFVFSNKIMLGALSLDLFAVLFGGATALLPIFADKVLHVGVQGVGILRAAPFVGAIISAIYMAYRPPTKNAGRNLLLCVAGFGLCMILFALSKSFVFTLIILGFSGMLDNVSVVVRSTIMQLMTPDNMRGRVSSVNMIFIGSSNEIGALESGVAATLLGLIPSVVFGGSMTLLVVLITAYVAPQLRKLNLNAVINSKI